MAINNDVVKRKQKNPEGQGEMTVLDAGTVESRGMGTKATTRSQISKEITQFLNGEAKLSVRAETRAFFTVWTFITRLPAPTWVDLHPGFLMRGMAYFPLAGSLVGIFVGLFFDLANVTLGLPSIVSAAICTGASFWVTGCFHEDGLADSADGIGGGWSRVQILKIMTDTRLGTYGCAILLLHTVTKLELLAALEKSHWNFEGMASGAGPALVVMHTLSRLTAPFLIRTRDYVDETGPKYKFYSFMVQAKHLVSWHRVLFALSISFVISTLLYGLAVATIMIVMVMFAAFVSGSYGEYLLGGVMGDYIGATICVTELLVLTILLAKNEILSNYRDSMQTLREHDGTAGSLWMKAVMQHEQPIGVLIRFMVIIFFTVIWCCFVGHPNVLVRESSVEAQAIDTNDELKKPESESKKGGENKRVESESSDVDMAASGRLAAETVCKALDSSFEERFDAVRLYIDSLAKPVGSLGALEEWAARLAALQRTTHPSVDPVACLIFAADHGAAKDPKVGGEGCSSYPQAVTRSILVGLERGIAGASVLAKSNDVSLRVVDVGVAGVTSYDNEVVYASNKKLQGGTRNMCFEPAMTSEEVEKAIRVGRDELVRCASDYNAKAIILGEIGIGNTTASSALIAQLTNADLECVCGGGATLAREADEAVVAKKVAIVKKALQLHSPYIQGATEALARLGGVEIASLVGAMLEASERNLPVLLDGFIVTAAALVAANISPSTCRIMFFSTQSAEKGQLAAIQSIQSISTANGIPKPSNPALSMSLRMGEASAALLAVPILRSAAVVLDMGTIQDILGG
jgi:nicotinate-nucleotide--dimethylbenzimidazole phosphoribosyltransferase